MVYLRCADFSDLVWAYVAEYARKKNLPRCRALEEIVKDHMRFMAEEQIARFGEAIGEEEKAKE